MVEEGGFGRGSEADIEGGVSVDLFRDQKSFKSYWGLTPTKTTTTNTKFI